MKKYIRLVSAVLMLVMVCTTSAFAASPTSSIEQSQDLILVQGEPIGSRADEDGFLLEDTDIRSARSSGLQFSMTANNVSKLLTTYSAPGKNFTGGAFDGLVGEGLLITGKVTDTSGSDVKVGACSYNANKDTFYTVMPIYFDSGTWSTSWIPKIRNGYLYMGNSTTYYGHITNESGSGTVSGTLNFSVSKNPYNI